MKHSEYRMHSRHIKEDKVPDFKESTVVVYVYANYL